MRYKVHPYQARTLNNGTQYRDVQISKNANNDVACLSHLSNDNNNYNQKEKMDIGKTMSILVALEFLSIIPFEFILIYPISVTILVICSFNLIRT